MTVSLDIKRILISSSSFSMSCCTLSSSNGMIFEDVLCHLSLHTIKFLYKMTCMLKIPCQRVIQVDHIVVWENSSCNYQKNMSVHE
jgi:hypothetical protein